MSPNSESPLDQLSYTVRGCIFNVHSTLGPGLFESAYLPALAYELELAGLEVTTNKKMPVLYKGQVFEAGYEIDLLVQDTIIIEVKSVKELQDVDKKRLLTYLRLSQKPLGFLVNFNAKSLVAKESFIRIINQCEQNL